MLSDGRAHLNCKLKEKGDAMRRLRMEYARTFSLILIALWILSITCVSFVSAATTTIHVDPPSSNVANGNTFNINITITDVNNLTGWEFKLFYLKAIVNCSAVTEGPFLKTWGNTFHIFNITNNYNSTYGRVLAACSLTGMTATVNGSGVLATVTFKALSGGDTPLTLADTKLADEKFPSQPIAHTDVSGTVHVTGPTAIYDIAVTNVTCLKRIVGKGLPNNITVTLQNQGDFEETFNVTIRANATAVGTKQVTLANGNTTPVIFQLNTTGLSYGNYTLSAYATPLPAKPTQTTTHWPMASWSSQSLETSTAMEQ